ncbi:hypothetical protein DS906_10825 [Ruegeria sp. A3M17]|nr:hypothetical protein DS906_10825 [Ruegeria sp. A3M17]
MGHFPVLGGPSARGGIFSVLAISSQLDCYDCDLGGSGTDLYVKLFAITMELSATTSCNLFTDGEKSGAQDRGE